MHGELHIFPSGPEECSPADTPYDQRSPSKESSLAPYEENHKAKKAYRNRVRAGVSQPHSPVEYPDNDFKKFDVENMTINHTFLFSEIYKDRTDGPDGGEVTAVEAKNTEMDEYSGVENTSTQDYTALNYVLSRLQMLENIRIKEAKEARDEYFHRFDNAVDNIEVEVDGHNDTAIEMSCTVLGEDSLLPLESASAFAMNLPLTPASSFAFPPTSTSTSTSTYATPIIALADPYAFEVELLDDVTASTTASTVTAASSGNAVSRELNEVHSSVENTLEKADISMSSQVGMIEELDEGRVLGEGEGESDMRQYTSSNGSSSKSTPSKLIKGLRPSLNVSSTKTETGIRRKKKDGEENEIDDDDDDDDEEEESIESNWSDKETSNPTDVHMTERNDNNDDDGEYDDKQNNNKSFQSDQRFDQNKNSNKEIKAKSSKDSSKQSGKEYETISEKIRRKKSLTKKKEIQSVYHEIFEKKYDDNEIVSESISEKIQRNKSIHKKKEIQSVYHEIFEKKFDEVNTEKLLKKKQKTDSFILPVLWKF